MPLIPWNADLSVGVKVIDEQHQKLVDLINQLNEAMHAGKGKTVLQPILAELVRYTQYHFDTEDRLMDQHKFVGSISHKAEHKKLVADVVAYKTRFDKGDVLMSADLMNFLRDWLTRHIQQTDRKLGKALVEAGAP